MVELDAETEFIISIIENTPSFYDKSHFLYKIGSGRQEFLSKLTEKFNLKFNRNLQSELLFKLIYCFL